MVIPARACRELVVDEQQLLALVNDGRLTTYDLDGHLRFRAADVAALIGLFAVA